MAVPSMALGMMNTERLPIGSSVNGTTSSGGAHPHQTAGKMMTMRASQKLGVARPMIAMVRAM